MPYLLLAIGLIAAGIALYRFLLRATPAQIKAALLSAGAIGIGLASLTLALTGRLPAAIGILVALWPLAVSWLRARKLAENQPAHTAQYARSNLPLTEKEALDILGLENGANTDDIRAAHIRLIKKLHPDQDGSDWLAQKINAAKDLLLKSRV